MARPKPNLRFNGLKAPEYGGARRPGCEPDDKDAVGWYAEIEGTIFNFDSPVNVLAAVDRMLHQAYHYGRSDMRAELRERLGLG